MSESSILFIYLRSDFFIITTEVIFSIKTTAKRNNKRDWKNGMAREAFCNNVHFILLLATILHTNLQFLGFLKVLEVNFVCFQQFGHKSE